MREDREKRETPVERRRGRDRSIEGVFHREKAESKRRTRQGKGKEGQEKEGEET